MKVIADFTLVPIGTDVSLSPYVAACEKILRGSGLKVQMHANGTNLEGEWDAVFAAVKSCHETVHQMGAQRIFTTLNIGTRTDREQSMEDKINAVEKRLGKDLTGRLGRE
jgi:uncharacterized protein (TIGR00106 family)